MSLTEVDCSENKVRLLSIVAYPKYEAVRSGNVTTDWIYAPSSSLWGIHIKYVCNKQPGSDGYS